MQLEEIICKNKTIVLSSGCVSTEAQSVKKTVSRQQKQKTKVYHPVNVLARKYRSLIFRHCNRIDRRKKPDSRLEPTLKVEDYQWVTPTGIKNKPALCEVKGIVPAGNGNGNGNGNGAPHCFCKYVIDKSICNALYQDVCMRMNEWSEDGVQPNEALLVLYALNKSKLLITPMRYKDAAEAFGNFNKVSYSKWAKSGMGYNMDALITYFNTKYMHIL